MTLTRGVRLVLLDIEGTTTPIAFVHDMLFPFARARLRDWLVRHASTTPYRDVIEMLRHEHEADRRSSLDLPAWPVGSRADDDAAAVMYGEWLMDRDRKSAALKYWQGLIWEEGYQAGLLHGEVYADVPPAIRRWRAAGIDVAIYSSGSELAQRRLFASTSHGDLTPLIIGFFDTAVGAKADPGSYAKIVAALGHDPVETLFVSDVTAELHAAAAAGCRVVLSVRPDNPPQPAAESYPHVASFDSLGLPGG